MLLSAASLLRKALAGKEVIMSGGGVIWAAKVVIIAGQDF